MDALTALLTSRSWVRRRVDRLEFLDLNTVHRTIAFTLDLEALEKVLPARAAAFPVVLLRRDAMRAGTRVVDAGGNVLAHLPRASSDGWVLDALKLRLEQVGIAVDHKLHDLLMHIQNHRAKWCRLLLKGHEFDGYADLAAEKWGCPAVGRLLMRLLDAERNGAHSGDLAELARLLFDWQNNYVLFVVPAETGLSQLETLEFSYDEELQEWQPPWERRRGALGGDDLSGVNAETESVRIGRAPFGDDLDALIPRARLGHLAAANRTCPKLRKLGRRGALSLAWHVGWEQASSHDVAFHLAEVTLPAELAVIRMRMVEATLRRSNGGPQRDERVVAAPPSMSRASLLAPTLAGAQPAGIPPLVGMFMSLVVAQRRRGSWLAGSLVAAVTGIGMFVAALTALSPLVAQAGAAVTILLLAPTLVSAVLSIRAASDIAQELTQALRFLIALIGVLTVVCAVSLILPTTPSPSLPALLSPSPPPALDLTPVKYLWLAVGSILVIVAFVLYRGWVKLGRQLTYRDPLSSGLERQVTSGRALLSGDGESRAPRKAPRIPPPDRWIETGEGDRVPWGWLWDEKQPRAGRGWAEDNRYWGSVYETAPDLEQHQNAEELVIWREDLFLP